MCSYDTLGENEKRKKDNNLILIEIFTSFNLNIKIIMICFHFSISHFKSFSP